MSNIQEVSKVLITGANGFIGNRLMSFFSNEGYDVYGWDVINSDNNEHISTIDMLNISNVKTNLLNINPNIIIHCAGNANVNDSMKNPEKDFNSNVIVTKNLLFSLKEINIYPRIVFLSSAAVYGNQEQLPISENVKLNPLSPYALDKRLCEEMCEYMVNNYSFDIKIARIFSVYGAGLKKQIFWDMYNKTLNNKKLEMFGTGLESRDYIHIDDLLNVIYLLATKKSDYIYFNVANGEEIKIQEVVDIFCKQLKINSYTFNNIEMIGNPKNWKADISRITELGYKREIDINDGIKLYTEWLKHIK